MRRGPLWGALEEIRNHLKAGYQAVYDADLKGYFDTIPHDRLLACVRHRIIRAGPGGRSTGSYEAV